MLIAVILLVVLLAALAGLFYVYHKVFYSPYRNLDERNPSQLPVSRYHDDIMKKTVALDERPCEFDAVRAYDGVRLSARCYILSNNAPVCLCFHGYRGSAIRDMSTMAGFLLNEGYNVILVDERAHWRSGGHTITYGIRERRDVLSWVERINERFGDHIPIYLFGISMGGGTVLMASGLALPDNVQLIAADCPFNSPKDIICHVAAKIGLKPRLVWPLIRLSALVYGHLNIRRSITAVNAVKQATKPILIIHGEADDFVPAAMSEEVQKANPALVERHTFPGADHGLSYYSDPDRYFAILRDFLRKNGGTEASLKGRDKTE